MPFKRCKIKPLEQTINQEIYDLIYEVDSKDNKPFPEIISEYDYTSIIQSSKVIDEDVVYLLEYISKHYELSQKQLIALGIIAREKNILITRGERKGTQYLINPELIKTSSLNKENMYNLRMIIKLIIGH